VESFVKEENYQKLNNQSCCGFAGTFSIKDYNRSKGFAKSKMDEIIEKDVDVVYSPCPGCAMQLADGSVHSGAEVVVKHPVVEIYKDIQDGSD